MESLQGSQPKQSQVFQIEPVFETCNDPVWSQNDTLLPKIELENDIQHEKWVVGENGNS